MNKILCSSGAIIGKANNNDYTLLKEYAPRLNCDGFELITPADEKTHGFNRVDDSPQIFYYL